MKKCKYCKSEIDKEEKICPNCRKKQSKSKLLIVIIAIIIIGVIASSKGNDETKTNNKFDKNKSNKVTVIDFKSMTEADIDNWCNSNKINCSINNEYSDTISKGEFINQSVESEKTIYEGDKLTITFSLGKEPTKEQKNALKKAQSYSENMHMSKKGIYKQLTSEYGEGFSKEDAQYAVDNMTADWNANALAKAKSYQNSMSMSKNNIYKQLISEYGEQFTKEEAQYAIDHLDD